MERQADELLKSLIINFPRSIINWQKLFLGKNHQKLTESHIRDAQHVSARVFMLLFLRLRSLLRREKDIHYPRMKLMNDVGFRARATTKGSPSETPINKALGGCHTQRDN